MFNTFSLLGFQCLDGLLIPEPLLLSAGQKLWLQKASFQSFSLISGYSFFNSLLLALFQALINLLSSVLDCAWNITYTWSMSLFHSSRIIPYPEAICSHIPFALSEIELSMTFFDISLPWSDDSTSDILNAHYDLFFLFYWLYYTMDCIIEQVFSFYFYAIHLPPAEEGEFLLYYVK